MTDSVDRRAIKQRSSRWAAAAADALFAARVTPNQVSVASVFFAAVGAAALVASAHLDGARAALLLLAAACVPLRLTCNLLDGLLAVERGMGSPVGGLFNDVPDRVADTLLLGGAGFAAVGLGTVGGADIGVTLGLVAAILAVMTAYVRALGAALGTVNYFDGPMAKPQRMWVLFAACVASVAEPWLGWERGTVLAVALALIAAGSLFTCVRRLRLIGQALGAGTR